MKLTKKIELIETEILQLGFELTLSSRKFNRYEKGSFRIFLKSKSVRIEQIKKTEKTWYGETKIWENISNSVHYYSKNKSIYGNNELNKNLKELEIVK